MLENNEIKTQAYLHNYKQYAKRYGLTCAVADLCQVGATMFGLTPEEVKSQVEMGYQLYKDETFMLTMEGGLRQ